MSGRAQRLERLLAIRMLTEDRDRIALRTALSRLEEAENSLGGLDSSLKEPKTAARAALMDGDRSELMMVDLQGIVAGWERRKLTRILVQRGEEAAAAMDRFLESRREHEQAKHLVQNAREAERVDQSRRMQTMADEWFLSKRTPEL